MTDYAQTIERLEEMKPRFDAGFSSSDRSFLDELHQLLFHKIITLTGCSDCYRDAYLIIFNKLKRDGTMPTPTNYALKPGGLIHFFGESGYYTHEVSDEIAERYLKANPSRISEFARFPEDWKERIADKPKVEEAPTEEKAEGAPAEEKAEEAPTEEKVEETSAEEKVEETSAEEKVEETSTETTKETPAPRKGRSKTK